MEPNQIRLKVKRQSGTTKKGIRSMKKLFSVILSGVVLSACLHAKVVSSLAQKESPLPLSVTSEMVRPHIVELAGDKYEGRGAGYPGELRAARYIAAEFKRIGLKPIGDSTRGRRGYFQEFKFQPRHPLVPWEVMTSQNVVGLLQGSDPVLKNQIVVIGAHYDGQGRSGQADPMRYLPRDSSVKDEIWNSANDNATSVAAILEIARTVKSAKLVTKRSILFAAFGAEEHGMAGSIYYVSHPVFPVGNHVAMINLEKLGRAADKPFSINGMASSPAWTDVLKSAQAQMNTQVAPNIPFATPDSDHYPFSASKIPAVMLYVSSNQDEAHFPSDTSEKVNFDRTAEAARFALSMLLDLASRQNRPEYAPPPFPDLGLVGHLVSSAEADARGLSAPQAGLKVTGVVPGLPASVDGLQAGDFIYEFANYKFQRDDSIAKLMTVYREVLEGKRGNSLSVKLIRDNKPLELTIVLRR
jgi:hypothetical protein